MIRRTFGVVMALALFSIAAAAQKTFVFPDVPDDIKAPPGEKIVYIAFAKGIQIYACQAGTDGKYSWALKEPRAALLDEDGKQIGLHFAGPNWKLNDGSEVTGKMAAKHKAPKAGAIPWLLVNVIAHKGNGALEKVTTIQRVNTEGGVVDAVKSCDASKAGTESESNYSAIYYFYALKN